MSAAKVWVFGVMIFVLGSLITNSREWYAGLEAEVSTLVFRIPYSSLFEGMGYWGEILQHVVGKDFLDDLWLLHVQSNLIAEHAHAHAHTHTHTKTLQNESHA